MEQKCRFPNLPHIVYSEKVPHNNLALPPLYSTVPEMSQANRNSSSRYHIAPADRASIDDDAHEDERLIVTLDEPELQPPRGKTYLTIHPTFWIRVDSVLLCLAAFIILVQVPDPEFGGVIPSIVFLIVSFVWNILVLICPPRKSLIRFKSELGTSPGLTASPPTSNKGRGTIWWGINLVLEIALIIGAIASFIIVSAVGWPRQNRRICNSKGCQNVSGPISPIFTAAFILGAVGMAFRILSSFLDGGDWRSCVFYIHKTTADFDSYAFGTKPPVFAREPRVEFPTGVSRQAFKNGGDKHEIQFSIPLNILIRGLNLALLVLPIYSILKPGFRHHDPLVSFLFVMIIATSVILIKKIISLLPSQKIVGQVALPLQAEQPGKGFTFKHILKVLITLVNFLVCLGATICWFVSITTPSGYRGAPGAWKLIAWIIVAGIAIFIYIIACIISTSLHIRIRGNPDKISTWRFSMWLMPDDDEDETLQQVMLSARNDDNLETGEVSEPENHSTM